MTGADAAWAGAIASLGKVNGSGIGVAVIDSGIADDHPALPGRVIASVDFTDRARHAATTSTVTARTSPASSRRAASTTPSRAPIRAWRRRAHLINLKVLDANGTGKASDVIEAIDLAIKYRKQFGIRVINLSLGAAPTQSYKDDPICLAVERAVQGRPRGGGVGRQLRPDAEGKPVYGSVTSPGISPYAITVGALRTQGTADPSDDEVAPWSSKGPTMVDHIVKPDLVAPGSKIVSTAAEGATLVTQFRIG